MFLTDWVKLQHVWGGGSQWQKQKKESIGEMASLFLCASQYLYTQSDPAVPRPREDPDEPGVDGRVYHVLSVRVIVEVPLEYLQQQHRDVVVSTATPQKWAGSSGGAGTLPEQC